MVLAININKANNHWLAFLFRRWAIYSYLVSLRGTIFFYSGDYTFFIAFIGDWITLPLEREELLRMGLYKVGEIILEAALL